MILKNVLVNIPFPIHLNLYHHKIMFCAFNLFLSSHFFLYHNAPSQQNQVTYIFYKSRRRPKFSDLIKSIQLGRPGPKPQTPDPQPLLCLLTSPCSHTLLCLPDFTLPCACLGTWMSISQFLRTSTLLFIQSLQKCKRRKKWFAYLSNILINLKRLKHCHVHTYMKAHCQCRFISGSSIL